MPRLVPRGGFHHCFESLFQISQSGFLGLYQQAATPVRGRLELCEPSDGSGHCRWTALPFLCSENTDTAVPVADTMNSGVPRRDTGFFCV